jgi:regulatory protein
VFSHTEESERARAYAFLLLKFRLRSEEELRQRLKKKKFKDPVIRQTLIFLKEKAFIDDREFAKLWIASRIKKPLGLIRLRQELRLKGVDQEIIDTQIEKIRQNYCEEEIVLKVGEAKFAKLQGIEPYKAKRRLFQYLARRGFSPDTITNAIQQLWK